MELPLILEAFGLSLFGDQRVGSDVSGVHRLGRWTSGLVALEVLRGQGRGGGDVKTVKGDGLDSTTRPLNDCWKS